MAIMASNACTLSLYSPTLVQARMLTTSTLAEAISGALAAQLCGESVACRDLEIGRHCEFVQSSGTVRQPFSLAPL